jgi:hypothetical protein
VSIRLNAEYPGFEHVRVEDSSVICPMSSSFTLTNVAHSKRSKRSGRRRVTCERQAA